MRFTAIVKGAIALGVVSIKSIVFRAQEARHGIDVNDTGSIRFGRSVGVSVSLFSKRRVRTLIHPVSDWRRTSFMVCDDRRCYAASR